MCRPVTARDVAGDRAPGLPAAGVGDREAADRRGVGLPRRTSTRPLTPPPAPEATRAEKSAGAAAAEVDVVEPHPVAVGDPADVLPPPASVVVSVCTPFWAL